MVEPEEAHKLTQSGFWAGFLFGLAVGMIVYAIARACMFN